VAELVQTVTKIFNLTFWWVGLSANCLVKPKFHLTRHVTSRHITRYLAHAFWHGEVVMRCDETCHTCQTARRAHHDKHDRRDSYDTWSGASQQRGVGWTRPLYFFQKFPRLIQIQSTKVKTKHVHESNTASSSAMLAQTRLDTLVTTRFTRRTCRVETWQV